jgi:hypothetical protein
MKNLKKIYEEYRVVFRVKDSSPESFKRYEIIHDKLIKELHEVCKHDWRQHNET